MKLCVDDYVGLLFLAHSVVRVQILEKNSTELHAADKVLLCRKSSQHRSWPGTTCHFEVNRLQVTRPHNAQAMFSATTTG